MANELIEFTEDSIKFTKPIIQFDSFEELKVEMEKRVAKYDNLVVTRDSYDSDKKLRRQINKDIKWLDDKRKEIKRSIESPIKQFDQQMKSLIEPSKQVSDQIGSGLKVFEDKLRQEKHELNDKEIHKIADELGIKSLKELNYNSSWDTTSFKHNKFIDEVTLQLQHIKQIQDVYEENCRVVTDLAKELEVASDVFIDQLNHFDLPTVIENMKKHKIQVEEMYENNRRLREAEKAAKEASEVQVGNKVVEKQTGEVVDHIDEYTLRIKGRRDDLFRLSDFMIANNIEFEKIGD